MKDTLQEILEKCKQDDLCDDQTIETLTKQETPVITDLTHVIYDDFAQEKNPNSKESYGRRLIFLEELSEVPL